MTTKKYGVPAALFMLALAARLAWVFLAGRNALASSDDAKAYNDLAVNLITRHQYVTTIDEPHRLDIPYAQRPPLTPFALAAVYSVFGPHLLGGQILLACVSALSIIAAYLLGKRLFGDGVGILAGILCALYPFFVFLAAVPLTENLAILLYSVLALLLTGAHYGSKQALMVGGVLGLAALNRPQILGFIPLVALVAVVLVRPWAKAFRWTALVFACSTAVMMPWMIRNRVVVGGWFPVSLQGGLALYMGNNPYAETPLSKIEMGARGWYDDPRLGIELAGLSSMETDRKAFHLATAFIRTHPGQALSYSLRKLGILFSPYDHPVARISWYPVLALGLLGFFLTARRWRELLAIHLLVLQTILTAAVFTSMPRFRAPVEPLFLLMAAFTIHQLWERRPQALRRIRA